MSFARESALTAGEQVILVQLARLATYGLKTSDGATLHVPASVATAADTAAVYVDRTRYESPLLLLRSSALRERWLACKA